MGSKRAIDPEVGDRVHYGVSSPDTGIILAISAADKTVPWVDWVRAHYSPRIAARTHHRRQLPVLQPTWTENK